MVRSKKKKRKKKKRSSRKNALFAVSLLKVLIGFSLLLLLVVAAGFLAHRLLLRKTPVSTHPPAASQDTPDTTVASIPPFEIYPEDEALHQPPSPTLKAPIPGAPPRVAIIVDDLGYDRRIARKFLDLNTDLTFSVLPHTPHTRSIAREVKARNREIMLHLPMEPLEYPRVNPGPGALLTSMSPDELIAELKKNLSAVPGIKGVNNHMGSKMTAESTQIYQIFSILKQQDLYFVDSRSTAQTVCRPSARLFQLPFAERDVFIDHKHSPEFIRKQIRSLIRIAKKNGQAVGIIHPSKTSLRILQEMLPTLEKEVELVPASQLVHVVG